MLAARLFGVNAVVRVGGEQRLDDGRFAGVIDFGDEVVDVLLRDANGFDIQRGAVDDGASGACGPNGHVEHGVQGGRHGLCEEQGGRDGVTDGDRTMADETAIFPRFGAAMPNRTRRRARTDPLALPPQRKSRPEGRLEWGMAARANWPVSA